MSQSVTYVNCKYGTISQHKQVFEVKIVCTLRHLGYDIRILEIRNYILICKGKIFILFLSISDLTSFDLPLDPFVN